MFSAIQIEIVEEDGKKYVYLSSDGSLGSKYPFISSKDLKVLVNDYLTDLFEWEEQN